MDYSVFSQGLDINELMIYFLYITYILDALISCLIIKLF